MVDHTRIAVITGGKGALGQALAKALRPFYSEIHAPGRDELAVDDETSVTRYFSTFSRLDLLINNAGITRNALLARETEPDWDRVLRVNLRGSALCSREAIPLLQKNGGGCVLFIGSHAGITGRSGLSAYASAKAGLVGLMQSLAQEHGRDRIRSVLVCPGFLETPMSHPLSSAALDRIREDHVLPEFNTLDEAARFIAQLTTFSHISGQIFQLDSRLTPWT